MKKIFEIMAFALILGATCYAEYVYLKDKFEAEKQEEINEIREHYRKKLEKIELNDKEIDIPEEPEKDIEIVDTKRIRRENVNVSYNTMFKHEADDLPIQEKSTVASDNQNPKTYPRPYFISEDEFMNDCETYEKLSLTYYEGDDTLADDRDELVTDIFNTIGDTLGDFGSSVEDILYVRNDRTSCDFEITRSDKSYSEFVLGMQPEPTQKTRRPRRDIEE